MGNRTDDAPDVVPMPGRLLATLPRYRSDGTPQEMRVTLDEWNGSTFVRLALWTRYPNGWVPDRGRFATIRKAELAEVRRALHDAAEALEVADDDPPTTRRPDRSRTDRNRPGPGSRGRTDRPDWTANLPPVPTVGAEAEPFSDL